jgi:hypothetical protein
MLRRDIFEVWKNDPLGLNVYFREFIVSGNPYFVWLAIEICVKHEKEFPSWLRRYLLQCAERIQSGEAKKGDLRKCLPWVFGFVKDSGPGNLLDPDKGADIAAKRKRFAFHFAAEIAQGEKPSAAMADACNETLDQERADNITEKTLRSWVVKEFDLKRWPRTAAEWDSVKSVARERFTRYREFLGDARSKTKSQTLTSSQPGKRSREIAP